MKRNYKLIIFIFFSITIIATILVIYLKLESNSNIKNNDTQINDKETTKKIDSDVTTNIAELLSTNELKFDNATFTLNNNEIYLTIDNNEEKLEIHNVLKIYYNRVEKSSFINIYLLTQDGQLYRNSLSTIKTYTLNDLENIKKFSLYDTNIKITGLYKDTNKNIILFKDESGRLYNISNQTSYK